MDNIPLIIPNFNQPFYTNNLVKWWLWYYPNNPVYVIDNNSDANQFFSIVYPAEVVKCEENNCIKNLTKFISNDFDYYVISDPDIMPHPSTPPNFLDYFKKAIDSGYHRAGFDLITEDIPDWNPQKATILHNEKEAHLEQVEFEGFQAWRAPIDTTFCMYTSKNSGWSAPMGGQDWSNSLRLFKAFHLPWYLHPEHLNEEMKHYFNTCKKHVPGQPSAGSNNYGL